MEEAPGTLKPKPDSALKSLLPESIAQGGRDIRRCQLAQHAREEM